MSDELRKQFEEWAEESYGGDAKRFFARCAPPHEDEYHHTDIHCAWKAAQYFYEFALASDRDESRRLLEAASHTLRSYQYGNAATGPAEDMATSIDNYLATGEPQTLIGKGHVR